MKTAVFLEHWQRMEWGASNGYFWSKFFFGCIFCSIKACKIFSKIYLRFTLTLKSDLPLVL